MKTIQIHLESIKTEDIKMIAGKIKSGAVVVFPSDTSYGLAANPSNKASITKLFQIKRREPEKQISCIFKDIEQMKQWAEVNSFVENIMKRNLPGGFTFLLKKVEGYPLEGETVGVRIPDFEFTKLLAAEVDMPFTATSANIAGEPSCYAISDFLEQIKANSVKPDLIIDAGVLTFKEPSTVVDLTENNIKIVREGSGKLTL